jgi:hypothetical protein
LARYGGGMYEGKPPKRDADVALHSVSWADLSSRLSAARDLRKVLAPDAHEADGEGSFDAASARWIADHAVNADGESDVNHDDLGNLKTDDPMEGFERAMPMPNDDVRGRGKA